MSNLGEQGSFYDDLEPDQYVYETQLGKSTQNELVPYLDTTDSIIQILQATGWYLDQKHNVWIKGEGAVLNKKGFLELRRTLFAMLNPGIQLSWMPESRIEEHTLSVMKAISIQFAMNLKEYGIPGIETFHSLMAQLRTNIHFHLMKSVKGATLKSLTQQIQTIYQVQGEMEKGKGGILQRALNKLTGRKEENKNETLSPI